MHRISWTLGDAVVMEVKSIQKFYPPRTKGCSQFAFFSLETVVLHVTTRAPRFIKIRI
jgi:hypothetical protein